MSMVLHNADVALQELGGGCARKVLSHNEDMMLVEVRFDKGGTGVIHAHPHVQCTYVCSGKFEFTWRSTVYNFKNKAEKIDCLNIL